MAQDRQKIYAGMQHLILCEGIDAQNFLIYYLNSDALATWPALQQTVQVADFGGINQLYMALSTWKNTEGFENIKSLLIIRDAETSATNAIQSVKDAFKKANLPQPDGPNSMSKTSAISTGFTLFPSCDKFPKNGTLEDLCLNILQEKESRLLEEIEAFMNKLGNEKLREFPHRFKSKLHTYFSITDKYVSLKIGEAAKAGAFNWDSPQLVNLRDFLVSMLG